MFSSRQITAALATLALASASAASFAADAPAEKERSRAVAQQQLDAAQARLDQAAREIAELSASMATDRMPDSLVFLGRNPNRAMLGIGIGDSRDSDDSTEAMNAGVKVMSVSPGGPAAGAGIKAGDVIVELNGKTLKRDKDKSPAELLMGEMAKLSPGDSVTLSYRREGKTVVAKLKAEKLPAHTFAGPVRIERRVIHGDRNFDDNHVFDTMLESGFLHARPFGAIELLPISPKLGQYFGTDKGLLIAHAPEDKELKLEDGDVLIDIDGRVPSNPGHAFRILGSYQPGEKVTLNILRQHKKTAIAITVPENERHGPRLPMPPRPPRADRPVSAPIPPVPPVPPVGPASST